MVASRALKNCVMRHVFIAKTILQNCIRMRPPVLSIHSQTYAHRYCTKKTDAKDNDGPMDMLSADNARKRTQTDIKSGTLCRFYVLYIVCYVHNGHVKTLDSPECLWAHVLWARATYEICIKWIQTISGSYHSFCSLEYCLLCILYLKLVNAVGAEKWTICCASLLLCLRFYCP